MFERLQKPFLTVETGEAYQPVQVCFLVSNKTAVIDTINSLQCLINKTGTEWEWRWQDECAGLSFNSLVKNTSPSNVPPTPPVVIGTLHLEQHYLFLRVHSFKRACLAVSFFLSYFTKPSIQLDHADFINKVFPMGEHVSHGFSELFDDHELARLSDMRLRDYQRINQLCEQAKDAEEAMRILHEYTHAQAEQPLPVTERYTFPTKETDSEVIALSFYIFLRGRELVAIRKWFGASTYNLAKAMDETIEQVFGDLDLDSLS